MDLTSELGDIRRRLENVEAERHRSEKVQSALLHGSRHTRKS
jgi:hypothetical protein